MINIKTKLRNLFLHILDFFASDINDCETGEKLGRGLPVAILGGIYILGYSGRPLVPRFDKQQRLTYWKQKLVFTAQSLPNFERMLSPSTHIDVELESRVLNIIVIHQGGKTFENVRRWWRPVCREETLWVAFGGTREDFETLDYPRKVFIDDPGIRTRDHQREKQSYQGLFKSMASIVENIKPEYIYFSEYDQLPLVRDLNSRQIEAITEERADVMGHWLMRIDGTGHPHQLYHEADPNFGAYWKAISRRQNTNVVLSMFGSGSFWTRESFLAVASQESKTDCYLEIYLPTLAHHLGFRVKCWSDDQHLLSNLPSPKITVDRAINQRCWTVHPIKDIPDRNA